MTDPGAQSGDDPDEPDPNGGPRFDGGVRPAVAFVLASSTLAVLLNAAWARLSGPTTPPAFAVAGASAATLSLGVVAVAVLRYEGVRPSAVGLAPGDVVPGVAAVGGLWLGLNAAALGIGALAGLRPSVGYVYEGPALLLAGTAVAQYLVVGPVEELAYRGYLQNKLVDCFSGYGEESALVLGIEATALLFAAMHVPNRLLFHDASVERLVGVVAYLTFLGVLYGVVYEATRNLVLVGLLHGTYNHWLLVVNPRGWPAGPTVALVVAAVVLVVATVAGYRRWVRGVSGWPRLATG